MAGLDPDRGYRELPPLHREQVVDDEPRHRLTRLPRRAAQVRREDDVREPVELAWHVRLVREHVEAGTDAARHEFGDQCLLLDDLASRRIDEASAVAEQSEPSRVDQALRLGGQRDVDRDDVCFREERVQVPELGEIGVDAASLRVDDAKREPTGPPGDGATYAPSPRMPSVDPVISSASWPSGHDPAQRPERTSRSPSTT